MSYSLRWHVWALFSSSILTACGATSGGAGADVGTSVDSGVTSVAEAGTPADGGGVDDATGGAATDGGTTSTTVGTVADASDAASGSGRQSLVWVWIDYANSMASVASHKSSFTHVAPTLYQINYAYTGGVAKFTSGSGGDDFDGLTSQAIADQTHALGMKCTPLVFGGAANSGTDQGIQNILNDSPKGAQKSFIDAMVAEAVSKGYDGYDLDWEVDGGTDYAKYGKPLEAFLAAFDGALAAKGKTLSLIVGTWFMKQSDCSGGTGLVDLAAVAPLVDQIIIMDYTPTLGSPAKICDSSVKPAVACNGDFGNAFDWMCADVPLEKISIGLDSDPKNGNNPSAGDTMAAIGASGVRNVAIWPEDNGGAGGYRLCDDTGIAPSSATWFGLFSEFLSKP